MCALVLTRLSLDTWKIPLEVIMRSKGKCNGKRVELGREIFESKAMENKEEEYESDQEEEEEEDIGEEAIVVGNLGEENEQPSEEKENQFTQEEGQENQEDEDIQHGATLQEYMEGLRADAGGEGDGRPMSR